MKVVEPAAKAEDVGADEREGGTDGSEGGEDERFEPRPEGWIEG